MTKIKFIQYYQTLDKGALKDFKRFAGAVYFNNGRDFKDILTAVDGLKNKKLSSKEFVKSLSGALGISQRTAWNRLSELMKIAEKYIAVKGIEKNKIQFQNITARYYLDSRAYNLFNQKYKANIKAFNKSKKGMDSFHDFYEVLQSGGHYNVYNNQFESYAKSLTDQITYHSVSFMINHYLLLSELLQRENITSGELAQKGLSFLNDDSTESFLNTIKEQKELHGVVSFHYYLYKAFLSKTDDLYYYYAVQSFSSVYDKIDDTYKAMFYQLLINYCIERTHRGDFKYYDNLFELYNKKLKDGIIEDLRVGNFPINNFRDYIFVALRLKKIDWIRWFIENYSDELPGEIRDDEVNSSFGMVYYHEADFEKALKHFNLVKADNYIHYTDSKTYKLRIFYETQRFEEALMELDNYKHYLKTHKEIPEDYKKTFKNFANEYSQLMKIKFKESKVDAELLKRDLEVKSKTAGRNWLIRRLDEIIS